MARRDSADSMPLPVNGAKWLTRFNRPHVSQALVVADATTAAASAAATPVRSSGHTTEVVTKRNKRTGVTVSWLLKHYSKPVYAMAEAAIAAVANLIHGHDQIPKCRAVYGPLVSHDGSGAPVGWQPVGAVVKLYDNFEDLNDFLKPDRTLKAEELEYLQRVHNLDPAKLARLSLFEQKREFLVAVGFSEATVMAYYVGCDDRHKGNWAIVYSIEMLRGGREVKNYRLVSIDFDRGAYKVLGQDKYLGPRTVMGKVISAKRPEESFDVTAADIANFPHMEDFDAYYTPTKFRSPFVKAHGYTKDETVLFQRLKQHKTFKARSYMAFLRLVLTPDAAIRYQLKKHIPQDSDVGRALYKELKTYFLERQAQIRAVLVGDPGFRKWWYDLKKSGYDAVVLQMHRFNDGLKVSQKDESIDIDEVYQNYFLLCRDVAKQHIDNSVLALEKLLKAVSPRLDADDKAKAVRLRNALHFNCQQFFEAGAFEPGDLHQFVKSYERSQEAVFNLCREPLVLAARGADAGADVGAATAATAAAATTSSFLSDAQKLLLVNYHQEVRHALHQLRQYRFADRVRPEMMGASVFGGASMMFPVPMTEYHVLFEGLDPSEQRGTLIAQTVRWLQRETNRRTVERLFRDGMAVYEAKRSGGGAWSAKNPLAWLNPQAYNRRSVADVGECYGRLAACTEAGDRLDKLRLTFTHTDWLKDSFNVKLAIKLLQHQLQVIESQTVVERLGAGGLALAEMTKVVIDPKMAHELYRAIHLAVMENNKEERAIRRRLHSAPGESLAVIAEVAEGKTADDGDWLAVADGEAIDARLLAEAKAKAVERAKAEAEAAAKTAAQAAAELATMTLEAAPPTPKEVAVTQADARQQASTVGQLVLLGVVTTPRRVATARDDTAVIASKKTVVVSGGGRGSPGF